MALFKKQKKSKEISSKELAKHVELLEQQVEQTTKELNGLKQKMQYALCKIGIIRFNPFKEIGGDQSFCIAMLDDRHNGVVVTSYYGRELNRIYAKPVEKGVSEYELCQEEKEAIDKAKKA